MVLHILPKAGRARDETPLRVWDRQCVGLGSRALGIVSSVVHRAESHKPATGRLKRPPRPLPAREVKFPPYEIRTLAERHAGDRRSCTTSSRR